MFYIQTTLTIVAIGQALGMLGYKNAYHMTTVGPHDHHDKWVAALEAKFEGKSTEYGKHEFDELFEGFDVSNAFLAGVVFIIQVAKVTEFTQGRLGYPLVHFLPGTHDGVPVSPCHPHHPE